VGAHNSALIGEDPYGIPNNLMPYIAKVASGKLEKLRVFGDDYNTPDGTGVRDYIHVMDLAEGHVKAIEFMDDHSGWHAINLGTGKGISVLEMVKSFERINSVRVPYHIVPRRNGDVHKSVANVERSKKLLNWQTKRDIDEMCQSTWQFQKRLK
jgi:UDP-glucose 4-epimerase